jgi:hypothetical protein
LEIETFENLTVQQLSAMLASVMDEFLAIKDRLPELEKLGEELATTKELVTTLRNEYKAAHPSQSYKGWLIYRNARGDLWGACAGGFPILMSSDEEYMLCEGAIMITQRAAFDKGWPL